MNDDRNRDGRFAPGNRLGTPFGPDNPPPKSPGRPKKGAWLRELEERVKDPRIRQGLADRLVKIALKGRDADAIKALQEIEDRTGEPVRLRIEGLTEQDMVERLATMLLILKQRLPPEHAHTIAEVAYETLAGDEKPWLLMEHEEDAP